MICPKYTYVSVCMSARVLVIITTFISLKVPSKNSSCKLPWTPK